MITDPDRYIEAFVKAGADILTVHTEAPRHIHRTLQSIRSLGVGAGVALNPGTSLNVLDAVLDEVDMVLVMSVNPGFAGQKFIPGSLDRIRTVYQKIERGGFNTLLEVDGGVNVRNAAQVREAGAEVLVAGSAVYGADDYSQAIRDIRGEN